MLLVSRIRNPALEAIHAAGELKKYAFKANEVLKNGVTGLTDLVAIGSPIITANPIVESGQGVSFNGVNQYLTSIGGTPNIVWAAADDFTVEAYINLKSTASNASIIAACATYHNSSHGWTLMVVGTGKYAFQISTSGNAATQMLISTASVVLNTNIHVAAVRKNGVITIYIDGVAKGSNPTLMVGLATFAGASPLSIGGYFAGQGAAANNFNGQISNVRISRSAIYTTNFTPPTNI